MENEVDITRPQIIRFVLSRTLSEKSEKGYYIIRRNDDILTIPSDNFELQITRTQESLIMDIESILNDFKETKGIDKIYIK
jgi:hypothetical protein